MSRRARWTLGGFVILGIVVVAWWALAVRSAALVTTDQDDGFRSADGSITTVVPEKRSQAPDLKGTTLEGRPWALSQDVGHVVVLNVWASWCAPCRAEAPVLRAAAEEAAPKGVRFTGLNTRDSPVAAKAFEDTFQIPYPSVDDQEGALLLQFAGTINPGAIPSTVVIDQEGRIAGSVMGRVSESTLKALIEPLLAERPPTAAPTMASSPAAVH